VGFNSLSYQRPIRTLEVDGREVEEYVVKIFSEEPVEDAWLEQIFEGKVGWVLKHEVCNRSTRYLHGALVVDTGRLIMQWDAYPILAPTATFPPVKLDNGFYYVNAFEPCVLIFPPFQRF
jgi:prenylcysteine oxidase / farnesylcysteine lyase